MGKIKKAESSDGGVFNSPLEVALRLLFIFKNSKRAHDLQRLVYYNYLLVHSSDVSENLKSIHADLPRRSCEILVNRSVLKKALTVLISRDLIEILYLKDGITYRKNESTDLLTDYFSTNYSKELQERALWLTTVFDEKTDKQLESYIDANLGKWGSEFSNLYQDTGDSYA